MCRCRYRVPASGYADFKNGCWYLCCSSARKCLEKQERPHRPEDIRALRSKREKESVRWMKCWTKNDNQKLYIVGIGADSYNIAPAYMLGPTSHSHHVQTSYLLGKNCGKTPYSRHAGVDPNSVAWPFHNSSFPGLVKQIVLRTTHQRRRGSYPEGHAGRAISMFMFGGQDSDLVCCSTFFIGELEDT